MIKIKIALPCSTLSAPAVEPTKAEESRSKTLLNLIRE
jgi:hypothetical protein